MRFKKQHRCAISVRNLDCKQDLTCLQRHGLLLNQSGILGFIIGKSGSGKTNLLINRLLDLNGLSFENVYIFSKSLYERKYKYFKEVL